MAKLLEKISEGVEELAEAMRMVERLSFTQIQRVNKLLSSYDDVTQAHIPVQMLVPEGVSNRSWHRAKKDKKLAYHGSGRSNSFYDELGIRISGDVKA